MGKFIDLAKTGFNIAEALVSIPLACVGGVTTKAAEVLIGDATKRQMKISEKYRPKETEET